MQGEAPYDDARGEIAIRLGRKNVKQEPAKRHELGEFCLALQSNLATRRHAHVVYLARRQLKPLLVKLRSTPAEQWPEHLNAAWKLLRNKPTLTESQILTVVVGSVSAAHACARAIDHKSHRIIEFYTRSKLANTFRRTANCAKRAPRALRKCLNEGIASTIRHNHVDLEVIEAIFDATVIAFSKFPNTEAARTVLDHLVMIKDDYSILGYPDQRKAENAIAAIAQLSNSRIAASDVFNALSSALDSSRPKKEGSEIHTTIVDYVATVASLWLNVGLRPSRASNKLDPTYTSTFHHFVDLVLTAMIEPWALRHLISPDEVGQRSREAYRQLRAENRLIATPAPRRIDIQWIVNNDHIKKALRKISQKQH